VNCNGANGNCNPDTGACVCNTGFTGDHCETSTGEHLLGLGNPLAKNWNKDRGAVVTLTLLGFSHNPTPEVNVIIYLLAYISLSRSSKDFLAWQPGGFITA
jgi:hypothetical protein